MNKEGETPLPELTLAVARYSAHNFNPRTQQNDILLLELNNHVNLDIYTPACLPSFSSQDTHSGQIAKVMGWGDTEKNVGSNVLLEVDVPIVTNNYCRRKMRKYASGGSR